MGLTRDATRRLLAVGVVHPLPSAINATLVAVLAIIAGGGRMTAGLLAIAMLGYQSSIGAWNDVVDAEADRASKPGKPIPAGLISVRWAAAIAILGASVGIVISVIFGWLVLVVGLAGYATGVAYDVAMRRWGLGWLCYAAAFPLLLVWPWLAVTNGLPPGWPSLLPVAALAGPAIHLANSLVDMDSDARTGRASLATRLGPRGARKVLTILMTVVLVLAWATLRSLDALSGETTVAGLVATSLVGLGVALSWREGTRSREAGWLLQAVGLACLGAVWLAVMTSV
jgi:4-hydroxybenzoate polyprenyltransferase